MLPSVQDLGKMRKNLGISQKEIERTIELGEKYSEGLLQRILISSYISGFDSLKINSRTYINAAQRDIIKKFTRVAMVVVFMKRSPQNSMKDFNASFCSFRP